jgi:hypothetical protein
MTSQRYLTSLLVAPVAMIQMRIQAVKTASPTCSGPHRFERTLASVCLKKPADCSSLASAASFSASWDCSDTACGTAPPAAAAWSSAGGAW